MDEKRGMIEAIVTIEWEMFNNVDTCEPASCQNSPESFWEIRTSIYEEWPGLLLYSYLQDLIAAKAEGRNLVVEKYARMDNLLPPLEENPLINDIVRIEAGWQEEIRDQYPTLYQYVCRTTDTGDDYNFSIYLKAELETYGDKTIEYYHKHVSEAESNNENLTLNMLERLVKKRGYESLDHAEKQLSALRDVCG